GVAGPGGRRPRGRPSKSHRAGRRGGDLDDGPRRLPRAARHRPLRRLPQRHDASPGRLTPPPEGETIMSPRLTVLRHRVETWLDEPDRGDVPGWVLITIMTAGLVAALWLVAEPLLTSLFASAINSVGG